MRVLFWVRMARLGHNEHIVELADRNIGSCGHPGFNLGGLVRDLHRDRKIHRARCGYPNRRDIFYHAIEIFSLDGIERQADGWSS